MTEPSAYRYMVRLESEPEFHVTHQPKHPKEAHKDNPRVEWRNVEPLYAESDLRELVQEWREFSEPPAWDEYTDGLRDGIESCAEELEELIDE